MKCPDCEGEIDILKSLKENKRFSHLAMAFNCECESCGNSYILSLDNKEAQLAIFLGFPGASYEMVPNTKIEIDAKWIVDAFEVNYASEKFIFPWK